MKLKYKAVHSTFWLVFLGLVSTKNVEIKELLQEKIASTGYHLEESVYDNIAFYSPLTLLAVYAVFFGIVYIPWVYLFNKVPFSIQSPLILKGQKKSELPSINSAVQCGFSDEEKYLLVLLVKARDQHVIMGEKNLKFALKTIFKMSDASINLLIKRSKNKDFIIHHNMMVGEDYFSANEHYYTQILDQDNEFIWNNLLPDNLKKFDNNNRLI